MIDLERTGALSIPHTCVCVFIKLVWRPSFLPSIGVSYMYIHLLESRR